jgi:GNAT superfamily N-acetyltransferase
MSPQKLFKQGAIKLVRLEENTAIGSFESADKDLNDFLLNEAKYYLKSLLAVTYLLQVGGEIAAYFSLLNDNLTRGNSENATWNKINRNIPNEKRRKTYPAVKIGRLAVAKKYAGCGLGSYIILAVQSMYVNEQQRAGCRFISVDAYRDALLFYQKNDFKFLTGQDADDDTRIMYFDLTAI